MQHLEELLYHTPKPEIAVPGFRQNLRRNLLNSHRFQTSALFGYRGAFYFTASLATALAVALMVFVIQPTLPGAIHQALLSEPFAPSGTAPAEKSPPQPPMMIASSDAFPAAVDPLRRFATADIDREFIRYLAERQYRMKPVNIEPIATGEVFAVNRYRLDNGKEVFVYTKFPGGNPLPRESY